MHGCATGSFRYGIDGTAPERQGDLHCVRCRGVVVDYGTRGQELENAVLVICVLAVPTLRWWTACVRAKEQGRYGELHFQERNRTCVRETYNYHMEYLWKVVPREKIA